MRVLQEEKLRYKNRLEKSIYQFQNLVKRLDEAVPQLHKEIKPFITKKENAQKKQQPKEAVKQTHHQKLNQELEDIQNKLKNIKI